MVNFKINYKITIELVFFSLCIGMVHTFIKFKILKLSLLSALSAGIVLTLIAKEMRENKETDEANG